MEQLTTPNMLKDNSVFPGENWFFYWRSSSSLWESKLASIAGRGPIFAPISWSLHSEFIDQYDFGENKPETDLKRLSDAAIKVGKELIFVLPIGPAPFLTNGGMPSYLVRMTAKDRDDCVVASLGDNRNINRIYSYFEPSVFKSFRKFVKGLAHYFSQAGIKSEIYGMNAYRQKDAEYISYFEDSSSVFDKGFNQYIKQLQEVEPKKVQELILNPDYEDVLAGEYFNLIQGLYLQISDELLVPNYSGAIDINFIGGDTKELIKRSFPTWKKESDYFLPLLDSMTRQVLPSSVLLNSTEKQGVLGKILKNLVDQTQIKKSLNKISFEDQEFELNSMTLFSFLVADKYKSNFNTLFESIGLKSFLRDEYPWMFDIRSELSDVIEDEDLEKVFVFLGDGLKEENFNKMLKLFMSGSNVFFDIADLDPNLTKRLEVFISENNLDSESLNFLTPIQRIRLGQGNLISFNSVKLSEEASPEKKRKFWNSMVKHLELKHLKVESDDGVYYFWKSRSPSSYELSFEQVRRVFVYNPTSYKRKLSIKSSHNFAYIKNVDVSSVEVKSTPKGVEVLLLPGGSVALDYGFYE